ncbi:carbohydrate kinase, YjeF related protein [Ruminiclostridium papyrosolvens DSM 2782]|uniref:Bifunctional NAD(P)H-hydrate repair enzyme n=1 Tax=Ruminiclostridium papyrosolvens DSM 2782 TaxID=588581 RepID=F1TGR7_9FIRM|nr:bifunctional ADP-dependent NAD(P)H-hydrate dehydratase/NAD(P)H-hydrate epimerase [Ruminiclostridium papyrosolvens]EGD46398.1 carbohydrate kinase, YjeF related protein [Ruminiclostridium papyrosolvens DSM 2782]WES33989.1 bifunctional ADP-dependent NAD(P)H-hydrate dehydratase/NAD(P)H-hydrate epimerase [Ruminiclostridium papyrosolvens DSM 2782]
MKAVTGKEMGMIDKYCIDNIGIPGIVLMENAALKVVEHVNLYLEKEHPLPIHAVIIAGKGNNAGDAFAAARHLFIQGKKIELYCLFGKEVLTGDAKLNFEIMETVGVPVKYLGVNATKEELCSDIEKAELVLDGIFGTGFRGEIQGIIRQVADAVNRYSRHTISIDIASGIDSATGRTSEACIKADKTVTFQCPKIGQLVYPGADYTGELIVESIGMPRQAVEYIPETTTWVDREVVRSLIPSRKAEYNKGNCGKVAVVSGSTGMAGSGCLTAKASLRTGSGLVYMAVPSKLINVCQTVVPEAVAVNLTDSIDIISEKSLNEITELLRKCDVAAIGPGLSSEKGLYNIIKRLAETSDLPVVLDADALNIIAQNTEMFGAFKNQVVVTPHPGEMSRLTGLDISYIQDNRTEVAKKFAALWGVTVVLKGARTVIADKKGHVYINSTGNAGMATAGSGDSLTGIIASLVGQGATAVYAAVAGVYLHGLAGDIAARCKGEYGLNAMDIVENIPAAIIETI